MKRRKLVALVAVIVFVVLGIVAVSTILFLTRSNPGREQLRTALKPFIARKWKGASVYVGHLGGNFLTELTIDSIEIRDRRGQLFLATGRVTLSYNPRDILDGRLYIRRAEIEHPYVHLVHHADGVWNYKEIFASSNTGRAEPRDPTRRRFGDYIVIDSARTRGATFLLTLPWHPDTTLSPVARRRSIQEHIKKSNGTIAPTFDGYGRTYAWRDLSALLTHARLADPDSDRARGKEFRVEGLTADGFEPTFKYRNIRASARVLGDSVWLEIPHFNLPGSTGTGRGKVWWGSGLPMRYDIAIRGDSVSLDDVNWVYPTLPRTGGGSLDLLIRNDPKDLEIINYKITGMDVRSTKSRLVGDMTFGTGAPELLVRDVRLRAEPLDFDLIRTLNGKPFPQDWQGQLTGAVKARGGLLSRFVVDTVHGVFRDAHVRGAVSSFGGTGELDILEPALTEFHDFHLGLDSLDLRTIEFLNPAFPRLGGSIAGTATLDSSWLDVRFSNADITHRDGSGPPSRFTGSGRVTYGTFMAYDVALQAEPLSLTMLARSYPNPLRGLVTGPIRIRGTTPSLDVEATLQNASAGFSFAGRLDADSVGGYGARGRGELTTPNLGGLLSSPRWLVGQLGVHYDVDLAGLSQEDPMLLRGSAALDVDRTVLDSVHYAPSRLRVHFADGRLVIDSARVRTSAATLELSGGIGLPRTAPRDSIAFDIAMDSLGGLRPYLSQPDTMTFGAAATPVDSLSGTASIRGYITGTMDRLNIVHGLMQGTRLYANGDGAELLKGAFNLRDVFGNTAGSIGIHLDSATYAGVALDTVAGVLTVADSAHRLFNAHVLSHNAWTATTSGAWVRTPTGDSLRIDSLGVRVGDADWRLAAASHAVFDSVGLRLDSLRLRNADTGRVVVAANVPNRGAASVEFMARRVPLRDLGLLMQIDDTLSGVADARVSATGTKAHPLIAANATLSSVRWHGVDVDRVTVDANAAAGRMDAGLKLVRDQRDAVTASASLPIDFTLFSAQIRNDSISGVFRADTTDLGLLSVLVPSLARARLSGQLTADVTVAGTWRAPTLDGGVTIRNGAASLANAAGIRLTNINGSAVGVRSARGEDSVMVQLTATGDGKAGGRVSLGGYAKNLFQPKRDQPLRLWLAADGFHAFNKRTLADLYVSTTDTIRLTGTLSAAVLTGSVNVDRGSIFLADREIARKQAVEILADGPTVPASASSAMLTTLMANLRIPNLTVTLGDVRLRSAEADVKLVGELRVNTTTARSTRTLASTGQLLPEPSLEGTLYTNGGTYRLNLGLVQREFQVLPNGTVTFEGSPDNPTLDIRAQYNVRRAGDRDLGVIVNLKGPLVPYPGIDFSSDAGYEIPPSDLVSYLIAGRPGFDFGPNTEVVSSVLAPTVSAYAADKLRQGFGSMFDVFRLQLGATSTGQGTNANTSAFREYLSGSTIDVGQQFGNVTISANFGFCQLASQPNTGVNAFDAVGAKAEYRFQPDLSMKLSYDPATSSRVCNGQQGIAGFAPTPWQVGLSLAHTWRF